MPSSIKQSAGILLYRFDKRVLKILLVHPGGPFWKNKDEGAWTIPKGEFTNDEPPLQAATREFEEELGQQLNGNFQELNPIVQKGGKKVYAWAIEGDFDTSNFKSNSFTIEWPPTSGRQQSFPEVDKAGWFDIESAKQKINDAQIALLDQLQSLVQKD